MPDPTDAIREALPVRFKIIKEIGRGGMATVYLAEEQHPKRTVAIKVLNPELGARLGRERFVREVEMLSNLNHPHIVPIFAAGEAQGLLYYVMPYQEGETLRERIHREGQLPIDFALQITRETAGALQYAHAKNVVHRDIKPENILISDQHAVVADFGIARAISAAVGTDLTETGLSVGTPYYMSPEQASLGESLDGRADIYSVGCVLYEMLAGEPPFTGRTAQAVMARHAVDPVPRLRTVRDSVPVEVEAAIQKALAKSPVDRHQTAGEFAMALKDVRADFDRALELRPNSPDGPAWLGHLLVREGRFDEALRTARRAVRLDPMAASRRISLSYEALRDRRYRVVLEETQIARRLSPALYLPRELRGIALLLDGRAEGCARLDLGPYEALRATCLHEMDQETEAAQIVDSLETLLRAGQQVDSLFTNVIAAQGLAGYYAWVADVDRTLEWVTFAYALSPSGVDLRTIESGLFDKVRSGSRFAERFTVCGAVGGVAGRHLASC